MPDPTAAVTMMAAREVAEARRWSMPRTAMRAGDNEAAAHSEESGEESGADACRDNEEDAAQGEGLGVGVGHVSIVVRRGSVFCSAASPRAKPACTP